MCLYELTWSIGHQQSMPDCGYQHHQHQERWQHTVFQHWSTLFDSHPAVMWPAPVTISLSLDFLSCHLVKISIISLCRCHRTVPLCGLPAGHIYYAQFIQLLKEYILYRSKFGITLLNTQYKAQSKLTQMNIQCALISVLIINLHFTPLCFSKLTKHSKLTFWSILNKESILK